MSIIITGFEPFGGDKTNPSEQVAKQLNGLNINGEVVSSLILPVQAESAFNKVQEAMTKLQPKVIVLLGLAAGRAFITPERVAINISDYPIKDNGGAQPIDSAIIENGENAYFSSLPIKAITSALNESNIPTRVSNSAGTYVCNDLFYRVLHAVQGIDVKCGFIHIPMSQSTNKNLPYLPLAQIINGITLSVEVSLRVTKDVRVSFGTIA